MTHSSMQQNSSCEALANKAFNVRITFDAQGHPIIGFVQGLYKQAENVVDILALPTEDVAVLATSLGITKAQDCTVQALIRKSKQLIENNLKINSVVSC